MLRAQCSIPCWRIVFSTFRDCMSFYTARVKLGRAAKSPPMSGLPESGRLADIGTNHIPISVITAHSLNG